MVRGRFVSRRVEIHIYYLEGKHLEAPHHWGTERPMPNIITLAELREQQQDIAAMNLMCALGLPGAENIDPARYNEWLDDAARAVEFQTQRHWHHFNESPESFQKSPGYFCCGWLVQTL